MQPFQHVADDVSNDILQVFVFLISQARFKTRKTVKATVSMCLYGLVLCEVIVPKLFHCLESVIRLIL